MSAVDEETCELKQTMVFEEQFIITPHQAT